MPSSIRRRLSLTLLLIGAAPATGWGQAEVYRFTGRATIYDLVGTVSLSAGEGQTTCYGPAPGCRCRTASSHPR